MIEFKVVKTDWDELEALGYVSVTDYCRELIKLKKPLPDRIEIYRGEMLCMTVTDVAEAAKIMPTNTGFKKYDSTKRRSGVKGSLQPRGEVSSSRELP